MFLSYTIYYTFQNEKFAFKIRSYDQRSYFFHATPSKTNSALHHLENLEDFNSALSLIRSSAAVVLSSLLRERMKPRLTPLYASTDIYENTA